MAHAENLRYDPDETAETSAKPPFIAAWRMNMVALSQKHNLYFVASRDTIHCYQPRNLKQILPSRPDVIVELPWTQESRHVGGYINPHIPHSINHLKIGNLGTTEILLMCCDDGDIMAFYTHQFQEEIQKRNILQRTRVLNPFFHSNVKKSAWGLAIHENSRLIAVSSNRKEVTIFALALASGEEGDSSLVEGDRFARVKSPRQSSMLFSERKSNFRIVLPLGDKASNIPAIDFVSDDAGEARFVVAVDIKGILWKLDMRARTEEHLNWMEFGEEMALRSLGQERSWGVLCLSPDDFRSVDSLQEAWRIVNLYEKSVLQSVSDPSGATSHYVDVSPHGENWSLEPRILGGDSGSELSQEEESDDDDDETAWFEIEDKLGMTEDLTIDSPIRGAWAENLSIRSACATEEILIGTGLTKSDNASSSGSESDQMQGLDIVAFRQGTFATSGEGRQTVSVRSSSIERRYGISGPVPMFTESSWKNRERPTLGRRFAVSAASGESRISTDFYIYRNTRGRREDTKETRKAEVQLLMLLIHLPPDLRRTIHDWNDLESLGKNYDQLSSNGIIPLIPSCPKDKVENDESPLILLRTYSFDIELVSISGSMTPAIPTRLMRDFCFTESYMDRFNMIHHIPELQIVLVATQAGTALILSLTKICDETRKMNPYFSCRFEQFLPLLKHQEHLPPCPLLGLATSPLQGSREGGLGDKMYRRWRVMLHYYDHTVLSYDVYRGERGLLHFDGGLGVVPGG